MHLSESLLDRISYQMLSEYFLKSGAMHVLLVLLTSCYIPLALFCYPASTLNHCHWVSKFMPRLFHSVLINTPLWFLGLLLFTQMSIFSLMHSEYILKSIAMHLLLVLSTLCYIPLALFFYPASTLNHCHRVSKFMPRLFHSVFIDTPLWFLGLLVFMQMSIFSLMLTLPSKTLAVWTLYLGICSSRPMLEMGFFSGAISVYKKMMNKQVKPDNFTYPSVLKACGEASDCVTGMEIHKCIEASSLEWSLVVHNALISMYGRFGKVEAARGLFNRMPDRDHVSWNTMIGIYASRNMWEEAFQLFETMCKEGIEVSIITWNTIAGACLRTTNFRRSLLLISQMRISVHHLDSVAMVIGLNACSHIGALKLGKEIHGHVVRTCSDAFDNIKNALVTMYSRCRDLRHAYMVFHKVEEKGVITWNAMLSGYANMDQYEEASFLFREMFCVGVEPSYVTIASILPLCARIANLQHGKEFHCYIMKREDFKDLLLLWNALVDMYARSGKVLKARRLFNSLNARDEVTYTSMIAGYGMKGDGETALKLFEEMCRIGIKPDKITMIAVLSACSHSGLPAQGELLFNKMTDVFRVSPCLEHYACMVDLFGRAGLLNKAKQVLIGMPYKPTAVMWATLLGACKNHGNTEMGEWAAGKLLEMKPDHSGYYVLIANMYAAAGCWSKLAYVRTCMRDLGVRKPPGCTWVAVGNEFAPFLVGDTSNPHASEIYPLVNGLNELMKDVGYVPSEDFASSEEDFEELNALGSAY